MTVQTVSAGLGFGPFRQVQPLPGSTSGVSAGSDHGLAGNGGIVEVCGCVGVGVRSVNADAGFVHGLCFVTPDHIVQVLNQVGTAVPIEQDGHFTTVGQASLVVDGTRKAFPHIRNGIGCGAVLKQFISGVNAVFGEEIIRTGHRDSLVFAGRDGGTVREPCQEVAKSTATGIGSSDNVVIVGAATGISGVCKKHVGEVHRFCTRVVDFNEFARCGCDHDFGHQQFKCNRSAAIGGVTAQSVKRVLCKAFPFEGRIKSIVRNGIALADGGQSADGVVLGGDVPGAPFGTRVNAHLSDGINDGAIFFQDDGVVTIEPVGSGTCLIRQCQ